MLCILKKNGILCIIFNLQQQNKNSWKDVTPFPDQDAIHHDIVRAMFRSKLDMPEAYEQMCIRPEDVCKTTFSTIFSTFKSQVMQMGDCNAPSTFLRVSYGCHEISKSTSLDCNKTRSDGVVRKNYMWESPSDSHAVAIQ